MKDDTIKNGKYIDEISICWYKNGLLHREDGPAHISLIGGKVWYNEGMVHREDGPAIEYSTGDKSWVLYDIEVTQKEFNEWLVKKKLNQKLESTLLPKPMIKRAKI